MVVAIATPALHFWSGFDRIPEFAVIRSRWPREVRVPDAIIPEARWTATDSSIDADLSLDYKTTRTISNTSSYVEGINK